MKSGRERKRSREKRGSLAMAMAGDRETMMTTKSGRRRRRGLGPVTFPPFLFKENLPFFRRFHLSRFSGKETLNHLPVSFLRFSSTRIYHF